MIWAELLNQKVNSITTKNKIADWSFNMIDIMVLYQCMYI